MKKIITIVQIFKLRASEYIICKLNISILRFLNKYSRGNSKNFVSLIRLITNHTDGMVKNYIYIKYRKNVFKKFEDIDIDTSHEINKVIWTAWLQGENNAPQPVQDALNSIKRHAKKYDVIIITNENLKYYIDVPKNILSAVQQKKISPAHYTDWIRLKLLSEYGGVWMDATSYMIKPLPDEIWNYDLLTWNEMIDFTGKSIYAGIPFVEHFNNGFLVAKKGSIFYQFAVDITERLLMDPILTIDYFSNFKAYITAFERVPLFRKQSEQMNPTASNAFLIKQYWNSSIRKWMILEIQSEKTIFFNLVYKNIWIDSQNGIETIQQYLIENY